MKMILQKKREELTNMAKQFKAEYKKECESKPETDEKNKTDWFLKACGAGIILLGLLGIDQHPLYALIFILIGIATCFAAHNTSSDTED
jgi:preprotein translocase subunit Sss1